MNKSLFNKLGWLLFGVTAISWIIFGYQHIYLLSVLTAYIFFSIYDGTIKNYKKALDLSMKQISLIVLAFIATVAVVFGLIQLSKFVIDDIFHLEGWMRTIIVIVAIILSLYPAKFTFGSVVYRVGNSMKKG